MYKSEEYYAAADLPHIRSENEDPGQSVCIDCGSNDVRKPSEENCSICGERLCYGDHAYEAGDLLICEGCITRVLI